jgi:hypothetical protein
MEVSYDVLKTSFMCSCKRGPGQPWQSHIHIVMKDHNQTYFTANSRILSSAGFVRLAVSPATSAETNSLYMLNVNIRKRYVPILIIWIRCLFAFIIAAARTVCYHAKIKAGTTTVKQCKTSLGFRVRISPMV